MAEYLVIALPLETAQRVRRTRQSPGYGHPVHAEVATGYGPCRLCLRDFEVGVDRRLLFTFDPFFGIDPFPLPGPVFIHESDCVPYPPDGGFPSDLRAHRLTLTSYARGRRPLAEEHVTDGPALDAAITRLLGEENVDSIHVRDTDAGCYDFRIEHRT